ncbi:capsular polysaccharide biosynthesis protein [Pusillimonas sp. ANT_WB101]|uniref:capsular polysaccharide biosynthesis protein n=1 Tax=Pusillimonas sp. ANT_WB101 TaxID=2597356 RepID=UPI0011EFD1BC|nr:capsular polysaccharide biosynthesis protein [Pusillimonas sp. ANT_WB101]KAA0911361.1 capsular polysaccharide biosynthesis protein [Pusillimonas sp. ANT_WB101]
MSRFVVPASSTGIRKNKGLSVYFDEPFVADIESFADEKAIYLGWGRKKSGFTAIDQAKKAGARYCLLEDGFLRSIGIGRHFPMPMSLIMDDVGIYYDATQPSRLEQLIRDIKLDDAMRADAQRAMQLIRDNRLSKYNHAPETLPAAIKASQRPRVLVVDQTNGDVSVKLGGATAETFKQMVEAAVNENPDADIFIKTHPDVIDGGKQGYLNQPSLTASLGDRVTLLCDDVSPMLLLENVDKVYVVSSQLGFEALLVNKPVVCFGLPWYVGWGLTDDRSPQLNTIAARRKVKRSLQELFAAAYLLYPRYINQGSGARGTIFDAIDYLSRNKSINEAARGTLYCIGFSLWKRAVTNSFLRTQSCQIKYVNSINALEKISLKPQTRILVWGARALAQAHEFADRKGIPVWRMEDGFIRSVGLGSDLFSPISLVVDAHGMYYDPASGSDLERILQSQMLKPEQFKRAQAFRANYVKTRVSKYNLGTGELRIDAQGRRILLVPGQVEDDASIMLGSPMVSTNQALLETVRRNNPDAYIIYKPHPDVVAGNRKGAVDPEAQAQLADQCVPDFNIIDCIHAVDEVHTMTSLAGFEALLHGRSVHCYGGPFYAGWGLTHDHFPLPHRTRRVTLDELIYAAMLEYPRYVLPPGAGVGGFVSAEAAVSWVAEQAARIGRGSADCGNGIAGWVQRKSRKTRALTQVLKEALKAHKG